MMTRRKIRAFSIGFFLTIIFVTMFIGIVKVDESKKKYSGNLIEPLYHTEKNIEGFDIHFFGKEISIDMKTVDEYYGKIQKYSLALPAKYRLILQIGEMSKQLLNYGENYYREWEYQQNIK